MRAFRYGGLEVEISIVPGHISRAPTCGRRPYIWPSSFTSDAVAPFVLELEAQLRVAIDVRRVIQRHEPPRGRLNPSAGTSYAAAMTRCRRL